MISPHNAAISGQATGTAAARPIVTRRPGPRQKDLASYRQEVERKLCEIRQEIEGKEREAKQYDGRDRDNITRI